MSGDGAVVRLVDRPRSAGRRTVVVSWQAPGKVPREASVEVDVAVDAGVAEQLRWYLEDFGEFPADPAPVIAVETERIIAGLGRELFAAVFGSGDAATLWAQASLGGLGGLRVEVDADPGDVPGLPWELLRDPATDRPLVVAAGQFVRTHREAAATVEVPGVSREGLRVLLVICRPEGREDVAFRSVASRLVRGGADRLPGLDLQVLRPATFPRLREVLRQARERGRPFHVVHFDGHGTYLDVEHLDLDTDCDPDGSATEGARLGMTGGGGGGVSVSPLRYGIGLAGPARPGRHGYLVFEKPGSGLNQQLVDGPTLAGLLVEAGVPVLVLNACRSAYAEAPTTPDTDTPETDTPETDTPAETRAGVHDRIRAYGSLAAEVADAGVPGVVAMRYNVYVVTAAQFVADLYAHLVAGRSLGAATTEARKALAADPTRRIGTRPVALQDWVVPTVYEPLPLTLTAPTPAGTAPLIRLRTPEQRHAEQTGLSAGGVPSAPDVGFFGRDETLLALDRAFDTDQVVLLHALAGAGKSTTAAEFARWYAGTGGLADPQLGSGPVVWTSFEHHLPLARVLDQVAAAFSQLLQANGIDWVAVTDPAVRRDCVLQVLAAVPLLWVWDNVEPVAGFPQGARSAWADAEQQDLLGFLRELRATTRAKVLLTSRRTEHDWLGAVPVRVGLPPMPMRERRQLAHALVRHLGPDTPADGGWEAVDWRGLLRFTGGNPLTITVAVRQALREHVTTTGDVEAFVARLQTGAAALEQADDAEQGRDRSLAASLTYGFARAFTDRERAVLAVLHLFRDTVHVDAIRIMGDPDTAGADAVSALAGADRDGLIGLLDRAVEIGLLTGYGGGYYGIHPALPWFFTGLFTDHIGPADSGVAAAAERAYARACGELGDYYFDLVAAGRAAEVLPMLGAEEANLVHGLELARTHHLPGVGVGCLQGLRQLYPRTGRDAEWTRLVGEIEGDYIDPSTDRALPGCDDDYTIVTGYRVRVARARRDWPTATRLQTARTAWVRARATRYLDLPAERLDATERYGLSTLAISEQDLGDLLYDQDDPACLDHYRAAYELADKIGDTVGQATQAFNLGNAYLFVTELRDLGQAQHWHQRSLDLKPEEDRIGRAVSHGSLAGVASQRFLDARAAGARRRWYRRFGPFNRSVPDSERGADLDAAVAGYQQALELLPADHHHDHRATAHHQLGMIYAEVGDVSQAMRHFQQSIQHKETLGDTYRAGLTRYNIALLYAGAGRPGDALLYARAALANFRDVGPGAAADADDAQALINRLERAAGG